MIESRFWKEELNRIARLLKPARIPPRWTERRVCIVERDTAVGFFILRRMLELHKVSSAVERMELQVYAMPRRSKQVTLLNHGDIDALYYAELERPTLISPQKLANHFVHAYTSFVLRDASRRWSDVLIVSDFERNTHILRVPIPTIRLLFLTAAASYPSELHYAYNRKHGDFDVLAR